MSKISLVIEIEKDEYWNIVRDRKFDGRRLYHFEKMIADGIPFPKRHGDLIDKSELLKNKRLFQDLDGDMFYIIHEETVINAPTIIEADGGR